MSMQYKLIRRESGAGHRKMDPAWAESVIRQCRAQGVPVFFKQSGGFNGGDCLVNGVEIKEWPTAA